MTMKHLLAAVVATLALSACSTPPKPSESFCSDLRSGLSPIQIYGGVEDQYTPEKFADLAYGFASISCPGELRTNQGLRTFLLAWDINPDV